MGWWRNRGEKGSDVDSTTRDSEDSGKVLDVESASPQVYNISVATLRKTQQEEEFEEVIPEDRRVLVSWHDLDYRVKMSIPHNLPKHAASLFPAFSRNTAHWFYNVVLSAFVGNKVIDKTILHGISGYAEPGKLIAIMGPSGSGKTTLLNTISGRVKQNKGQILFNGSRRSKKTKRQLGYVMQEDVFFANLTVQETLTFTALLRLSKYWDVPGRKKRIDEVVSSLMLNNARDTVIGNQMQRGVSGGERKRANIANEMLTNPSVLFLDEPTSGLDSSTALALILILKKLARGGMTIVTTLHQPSSQIYEEFDKLLLLAQGHVVFDGAPADALKHFEQQGFRCPPTHNPADFFLSLLVDEDINEKIEPRREMLIRAWAKKGEDTQISKSAKEAAESRSGTSVKKFATPFWWQLLILMWRGMKQKRGETFQALTFFQIAVMTTIVSLSWQDMQYKESAIADRVGFLFFIGVFFSFFSLFDALNTFPTERTVLRKERASGSYRLSMYFVAKNISDAPLIAFWPSLFWYIAYWAVNLQREPEQFFYGWITLLAGAYASEGFGLMISASIMNVKRAIVFSTVMLLAMMLISGFYVKNDNLSVLVTYMQYISFIKYVFEGLLINEMTGATFECATTSEYSECPGSRISGSSVLDVYSIEGEVWHKILCLLAFSMICRFIAYLFLRYLNRGNQWAPPTPYGLWTSLKKAVVCCIRAVKKPKAGDEEAT